MSEILDEVLYWLSTAVMAFLTLLTIAIAVGLSRGFFRCALSSRSWRHIFSFSRMSTREKQLSDSIQAEELVEAALRAAGWRHVFLRRRVPVQRLGHNREIDVVAVGPVVLVVEVKHWRGQVWSNGPRWFQCPSGTKRALEFEDIQEDNLVKAAALRRFIENGKRIPLSDYHLIREDNRLNMEANNKEGSSQEYGTWYTDRRVHKQCGKLVVPVVVFTNPAVMLDPNTVKQKKHVFNLVSFKKFAEDLMKESRGPSFTESPLGYLVHSLRCLLPVSGKHPLVLSSREEKQVATAVDIMRTWDMIYLHNNRLIHGDVTELDLPSIKCHIERKYVLNVEIKWFDGVLGFVWSLWEGSGGVVRIQLSSAQRLIVRRDEIVIPIARRNLRYMRANDRLVIKLAGTKTTEAVALADISSLRFSHHIED